MSDQIRNLFSEMSTKMLNRVHRATLTIAVVAGTWSSWDMVHGKAVLGVLGIGLACNALPICFVANREKKRRQRLSALGLDS